MRTFIQKIMYIFGITNFLKLGILPEDQARLAKAFDGATLAGKLVSLNEEQANTFVEYLKDESALLREARVVKMQKSNRSIAKLFLNGDFLYPGNHTQVDRTKDAEFWSDMVELTSKLLRGQIQVTDQEIEDNIEGGKIGEKFIRMVAKKVANELEVISMYARKRAVVKRSIDLFDGYKFIAMQEGHRVNAADTGTFTDRTVKRDKFIKAKKSMPSSLATDAKFFVSRGTKIDYNEQYTVIADSGVRQELTTLIAGEGNTQCNLFRETEAVAVAAGINTTVASAVAATPGQKVINVASGTGVTAGKRIATGLGTANQQIHTVASVSTNAITMVDDIMYPIDSGETFREVTLDGADSIYTNPQNLIYGIQVGGGVGEGITFEVERKASVGYVYHLRMRIDFKVENTEGIVLIENMKVL